MLHRIGRVGVALLLLALAVAPALARKKGPFEHGTWKIKITPDAEAAARGEKQTEDSLVLYQGIFRSTACDQYGFATAPYTLQGKGFSADTASASEGRIHWSGTIDGDSIAGRITWTRKDGSVLTYTFSGARAPAEKAKKRR